MSQFFGGGFTAPPGNACKLRAAQGPFQQPPATNAVPLSPVMGAQQPSPFPTQPFTVPMHQLGGTMPYSRPLSIVQPQAEQSRALAQAPQAPAEDPRQYVQGNTGMGPVRYPVMKKGEAPCPICRG